VLLVVYIQACLSQIDQAISWASEFSDEMEKAKLASSSKEARIEAIVKEAERLVLLFAEVSHKTSVQEELVTLLSKVDSELESLSSSSAAATTEATATSASAPTQSSTTSEPLALKLVNIKEFLLTNCATVDSPTLSHTAPQQWTATE